MRKLFLILAFLILAPCVMGQSTTVSGTVQDLGGQTWNNGTVTITFVPNPNFFPQPPYTWTGGVLPLTVTGPLSATGTYSISVPSSSAITPQGSTWNFKFCSQATAPCFTAGNALITGATQTINATPPAILVNVTNPTVIVRLYSDAEVGGAVLASQYYNLTSGLQRQCQSAVGDSCITWANIGGGGSSIGGSTFQTCVLNGASSCVGQGPGIIGQNFVSQGNATNPSFVSPGIPDGNGGAPVTTSPYTIQCDSSTTIIDRSHILRFRTGASVVNVPLSTATGCGGGFSVIALDESAGTLTFNRTSADTFSVYNGSSAVTGQTNFTLNNGQYATLYQGAVGIWEVLISSTGAAAAQPPNFQAQVFNNGAFANTPCFAAAAPSTTSTTSIFGCNVGPTTSANVGLKPFVSNVQYLSNSGNDTYDGLSPGTAKLTLAAACAALSGGNSNCTAGQGTIYCVTCGGLGYVLPAGTSPKIELIMINTGETGGAQSNPLPYIDFRTFGGNTNVTGDTAVTSATTVAGTSNITVTTAADFVPGDDIVIPAAGAATTQTTPGTPTAGAGNITGTASISYKCVGVDLQWGLTAASAAVTVSNAPNVFGIGGFAVSNATWVSNVVTITTSTAMPFSSGTFHIMVPGLSSGGNFIGGIRLATITSSTTLTYALTGSGTITTPGASRVLFVNGFIITQAAETAGSNQVVLTLDANHNYVIGTPNVNTISEIFIDGTSFANEDIPGYANGVYTITSSTANTLTITTPYTAKFTQNASPSVNLSTGAISQMSVISYAKVGVLCPANADGTPATGGAYYAIYANYGSGYAPIGFSHWYHSAFYDYGPAYTQNQFIPPPGMALPATPPVAAVPQVFEGKIKTINGLTFGLDRNVPTSVTNGGYHSNGISLQNAVNMACQRSDGANNQQFYPVLIPAQANFQYWFNAPVDLHGGSNVCQKANILQAGTIRMNGTIYNAGLNQVTWSAPKDFGSGWFFYGMGGGQPLILGYGSPLMGTSPSGLPWTVEGIRFQTNSSGQVGFFNLAQHTTLRNDSFTNNGSNLLTAIPLVMGGGGFESILDTIDFGTIPNPFTPAAGVCVPCGWSSYWPVPNIQVEPGPVGLATIIWRGKNYGSATAMKVDLTEYQGDTGTCPAFFIEDVETFQGPYQPLLTISSWPHCFGTVTFRRVQMDSIIMPVLGNLNSNITPFVFMDGAGVASTNAPTMTGYPVGTAWTFGSNQVQGGINELVAGKGGYETMGITQNTAADPFNRASLNTGGPCISGSCWTTVNGTMSIVGNQLTAGNCAANVECAIVWNGNTFSANQSSSGTVVTIAGGGAIIPMVRYNAAINEGYICANGAIQVANFNNSTFTTVQTGTAFTNGDFVWCDANGTTITVYDVTQGFTYSGIDSTITNGAPGVASFTNNTSVFDNWSGGGLHSFEQADAEISKRQPLHVPTMTVGTPTPTPTPGALVFGTNYAQFGNFSNYVDFFQQPSTPPANPPAGFCRGFFAFGGQMTFTNNAGTSCGPAGGGGGMVFPSTPGLTRWISGTNWAPSVNDTAALTGQPLVATNAASSGFASPGIQDGNGQLHVTTTPYTVLCDSATAIRDRGTTIVFDSGASVITMPDHTASGCGNNNAFVLINNSGGNLTVNRGGSDTLDIYGTGVNSTIAATTFTLGYNTWAALNNGEAARWNVRLGGGLALPNTTTTTGTTAVAANSCNTVTTVTVTGLVSTQTITFTPNADVSGVTGWGSTGGLVIDTWPTANTVNYKVCNQTANSITPSASVTWNLSFR